MSVKSGHDRPGDDDDGGDRDRADGEQHGHVERRLGHGATFARRSTSGARDGEAGGGEKQRHRAVTRDEDEADGGDREPRASTAMPTGWRPGAVSSATFQPSAPKWTKPSATPAASEQKHRDQGRS